MKAARAVLAATTLVARLAVVGLMAATVGRRYTADTAARYTDPATSWGEPETSRVRQTQLDEVEAVLIGLGAATAYDIAQHLPHLDLGTVSARLSQLVRIGRAHRTDTRRRTRGRATATVVVPVSSSVPPPAADDPVDVWIRARSSRWGARQLAAYDLKLLELVLAGHGRRGLLAKLVAAQLVGKALKGEPVDLLDAQRRLAAALRDARADQPDADVDREARAAFRAAVRPLVTP